MMHKTMVCVLAVLAVAVPCGCFAAEASTTDAALPAVSGRRAGDVMMGGQLLLRVRCGASGYTVEERAEVVQGRVNDLLKLGGFDLNTVHVLVIVGGEAALFADEKLVITVDHCTARANNTTPEGLAEVWARRLREIYPTVVPVEPPREDDLPES